jgi:hypothetical protein
VKRYPDLLTEILAYISIYPLLLIVLVASGLSCGLLVYLTRASGPTHEVIRIRSLAALATTSPVHPAVEAATEATLPSPTAPEALLAEAASPTEATMTDGGGAAPAEMAQVPAPAEPNLAPPLSQPGEVGEAAPSDPAVQLEPSPTPTLNLVFEFPDSSTPPPAHRSRRPVP